MENDVVQNPAFDLDLSGYDFYSMTNEDIQNLLNSLNLELGRMTCDVSNNLEQSFNDSVNLLDGNLSKSLGDVNKNVKILTEELGTGFDDIAKLSDSLSNIYMVGIALLVGIGLIVGLLCGLFVTKFLR